MIHDIPRQILDRMRELEALDARDRRDGTSRMMRLRQITPDTGRLLAILAASAPSGNLIEIGTSGGYSTLWLALAARAANRTVVTFEILKDKTEIARETFRKAALENVVELVHGDALRHLGGYSDIAFCFLDSEKEDYSRFYDLVVPRMVTGGLLVADNVLSHADTLSDFVARAEADIRVDSVVVPIGRGELLCRKT